MRRKKCHSVVNAIDPSRSPKVQQEIDKFLRALSSYPERFANDPQVSFEQHLFSIMTLEATADPRARQH